MIHINRNRKDGTGGLIKPSVNWIQKADDATKALVQAIKEAKDVNKTSLTFDARIYADKNEIRVMLAKLFYGKCSYCEAIVDMDTFNWEVEHFRPKARVDEDPAHPGYYWLAYKWDNLYVSCQYCNQLRRDNSKSKAKGKSNHFPLRKGSPRATGPECDIMMEERLLIDPCLDDPEDYVAFNPEGKPYAIDNNEMGQKSIEVFHLDRPHMNRYRKKHVIEEYTDRFAKFVEALELSLELSQKYPGEEISQRAKDLVRNLYRMVNDMALDEKDFAAVARAIKKNPKAFNIPELDMTGF